MEIYHYAEKIEMQQQNLPLSAVLSSVSSPNSWKTQRWEETKIRDIV